MCNQSVEPTEQEGSSPLWQQVDQYLQYPLNFKLLPVLLIWAVVAAVIPPLPMLLAFTVLGGIPAFGFAQAIMADKAQPRRSHQRGRLPGWQDLSSGLGWKGALLQAVPAIILLTAAVTVMIWVSAPVGLVLGVVAMLLMPALWLSIQVQGVDPGAWAAALTYMVSAPRDYLAAALLGAVGWLSSVAIVMVLMDVLPEPLVQAVGGALAGYWWLSLAAACAAMLGRHGRLWGLNPGATRVTQPLAERRQRVLLCAGRFEKVLLSTAKVVKTKKARLADWKQYDQLLRITGKDQERQQQVEPYLDALVVAGDWATVMQVLNEQRQRDASWLPAAPSIRLAIAQGVYDQAPKMAVALLKDLHQRHPDFTGLGEAYLLLAKTLNEKFGLAGKAEQYLRFVEGHCREAKLRMQVSELRQAWSE
nr:MFS transporter [Alcanivorax sp. DP30]